MHSHSRKLMIQAVWQGQIFWKEVHADGKVKTKFFRDTMILVTTSPCDICQGSCRWVVEPEFLCAFHSRIWGVGMPKAVGSHTMLLCLIYSIVFLEVFSFIYFCGRLNLWVGIEFQKRLWTLDFWKLLENFCYRVNTFEVMCFSLKLCLGWLIFIVSLIGFKNMMEI